MFENLSDRLSGVFDKLTKQGALSDDDVRTALREVRVALLEADVSLPVARDFVAAVQEKATGQAVTKSITPGQQVVKIVHDELERVLTGDTDPGALKIDNPPAPILMVGLQGSGKTTTTAKLAKRAKTAASLGGYDVYMLDTAGRLHIDAELIAQAAAVRDVANPRETLLVVDGLTGQDAVNVAQEFDDKIGVTGVVLTRMDGDGRGGAALSMRAITGKPIRFVGLGEKMDALETFEPGRIAGRILGMGDIVALVEKAQATIEAQQAEKMMKRFQQGRFNMNDLKTQLEQMLKMGGMQGMMGMLPGMGKMKGQMDAAGIDDSILKRQIALINSMTKKERANPDLLAASRKKRIAAGAGLEVSELNKLVKQHRQMADMMKKMGKGGMLKNAMKQMMGKGGMPDMNDPAAMQEAAKALQGKMPAGGLPGLGGGMKLPAGLSGFGKKK